MQILSLEATDLFSYAHFHLPLVDLGMVLVEGENRDEGGSNGAGKSTIFKALSWTLFGDPLTDQKADEVIRIDHTTDEPITGNTRGIVKIELDGQQVEVHRHRQHVKHKNKILVFVDGKEQTKATDRETQQYLENMLALDAVSFQNAVLFPQGSKGFVAGTDSQQKAILERILSMDRFSLAQDKAKKELADLKQKLADADSKILGLLQRTQDAEHTLRQLERQEEEFDYRCCETYQTLRRQLLDLESRQPELPPELFSERDRLQEQIAGFQSVQQKVAEVETQLRGLIGDRSGKAARLQSVEVAVGPEIEQPPKPEHPSHWYKAQVDGLEKDITKARYEVTRAQSNLSKLKTQLQVRDSTQACSKCGQPLSDVAKKKLFGDLEEEIKVTERLVVGLQKQLDVSESTKASSEKMHQEAARFEQWEARNGLLEQRDGLRTEIASLDSQIRALESVLSNARTILSQHAELQTRLNALQTKIDGLRHAQTAWVADLSRLRSQMALAVCSSFPSLALLTETQEKIEALQANTAELEAHRSSFADRAGYLQYWEKGFGNGGVKSLLLDTVTPFLNERVGKYVELLTGGAATVEFCTQTMTASGDLREKFGVDVRYRHGYKAYRGCSGGEKHKVGVAALFALGDLAASRSRASVRLRLLDEPFDNLDSVGKERVFELMRDLILPEVGTLLVMSHDERLSQMFESRILVVKENGVSRLEV